VTSAAPLLERLIAVPTHNPGGDERELARLCGEMLRQRGADQVIVTDVPRPDQDGAFVLARYGNPSLLINAHLDTVPANTGWSGDPWLARRTGDRIIGLGACDTKGSIAAILSALEEQRPRDTAILFSGDEERTGTVVRAFLDAGLARGITRAIVCEPTGCRAGVRHRGVLAIEASLEGQGGHSSYADTMPAPIADLSRLAVAWSDWGRARVSSGPEGFPGMCLNIASLDGGIAFNVVPKRAKLCVSVRPPPGDDVGAVRRELEAIARQLVPGVTLSAPVENASFATREPGAFEALLGGVERLDMGFWTEAALLSAAGIDAVVFGPGDIAVAHGADEFLTLAELERARDIYVRMWRGGSH
jgi:acetylornithine deacetylase